jgi:hypothetical protein
VRKKYAALSALIRMGQKTLGRLLIERNIFPRVVSRKTVLGISQAHTAFHIVKQKTQANDFHN